MKGSERCVGWGGLQSTLEKAAHSGGWIVITNPCSSLLPLIIHSVSEVTKRGGKVDENFRAILIEGGGSRPSLFNSTRLTSDSAAANSASVPAELMLQCRPLHTAPERTVAGAMRAVADVVDERHYELHYQGGSWRRALWLAGAVYAAVSVTAAVRNARADSPHSLPVRGEAGELEDFCTLEDLKMTFDLMYRLSLLSPLSPDTVLSIMGLVFGHEEDWRPLTHNSSNKVVNNASKNAASSAREQPAIDMKPKLCSKKDEADGITYEDFEEIENILDEDGSDVEDWHVPEEIAFVALRDGENLAANFVSKMLPNLHNNCQVLQGDRFHQDYSKLSSLHIALMKDPQESD